MSVVTWVTGVIVIVFAYEQWKTWRRTTAWRRVPKHEDDGRE